MASAPPLGMATGLYQALVGRVQQEIALEARRDAKALYELIDPQLRTEETRSHVLSGFAAYLSHISAAQIQQLDVTTYLPAGLPWSGNRPTAMVTVIVKYDGYEPTTFRTPWVLDDEKWFTRAVGKVYWPNT